jgi:hypothetical protein
MAAMMMVMSEEDDLRAMSVDRSLDENLPILRSEMTISLGEMERQMEFPANERDDLYAFSQLDWAKGLEDYFAAKEPGLAGTLRAEVMEIAASARRLRGMCLTTLAAMEEEDIVCVVAAEYLEHVAMYTTQDAAVAAGAMDPGVLLFVEEFVERAAGMLRRGAAEFGGEDAAQFREQASKIEALCTDTEALLQKMVSSSYWRSWRCLPPRGHRPMDPTPLDMTPMDDTTPPLDDTTPMEDTTPPLDDTMPMEDMTPMEDTTPLLSNSERSDQQ